MFITIQIIVGLLLLFGGGEILVRGSTTLAQHFGIPKLIIGLTIVALGTSAPEILVSIQAALTDHTDIALGNIVGSNLSNILLVLGVTAMIYPVTIHDSLIKRDAPILVAISLLFVALCWTGKEVSSIEGATLLLCLLAYTIYTIKTAKNHEGEQLEEALPDSTGNGNLLPAAFIIGGVGMLAFGADILVEGAASLARNFNISEAVIGLTIVAVGSSAPELATCIIAAKKKQCDLAAGNIVGSNLINIMGGIGIPASITALPVAINFFESDLWVFLAATIAMFALMRLCKKLNRLAGSVFFLAYIGYIVSLF